MRIACDKCNAVYSIAEKIIGPSGRIVKCAKCDNSWKVYLPASEETPPPYQLANKEADPALAKTNKLNVFLRILAVLLTFLMIFMGLFIFSKDLIKYKYFKTFYGYFSIYDITGIKLEDFTLKMDEQDAIINGTLVNNTSYEQKLPKLRYILLDKNKTVIFKFTTTDSDEILKPGERMQINTKISNITKPAKYLQIDVGNNLDFILR